MDGIYIPKVLMTTSYPLPTALQATLAPSEPTCYSQAIKTEEWRATMAPEFGGTWTLVPVKPGSNIVGWKSVYKVKQRSDGTIDRYKARLVAKGFHQ